MHAGAIRLFFFIIAESLKKASPAAAMDCRQNVGEGEKIRCLFAENMV